jgi:hypothetical protein
MDLRGIIWSGMYCIHLAQNKEQRRALANKVMNLWGSLKRSEVLG